ncbi:Neuron navigator 3 [Halotydeus destructor]|nr:Neuron navigator 3 [Halotydeus destructor]
MSVNSSNNRPKSAASATSSNSSCNAANDGNNNATHCKGPLYDGLYDISNMTLANGCLKSTSRTGSGKATTQATFGPLQGRPADPGVRGDKQSQLPEIVAAGPVTGPPLAFGGSKSQRDMMAKETPRAHLDCPQFKAARVGDIGQQLPSLASSATLSSSPSSSPPTKGDPGPNVKLKSLPPAMAAIAGHPSHICYSSSSTPNLHNDFTKAHPSPLAVTGDPNRLSRPNNGRPLDGKGSPVSGHNFAHYQSHQDQHALSRKLDATTGSASRDDATNHFAPCVTVTHQGDRLITKSISEHMLTPLPITGSVQTNGHQLTDSSKAGQCDVQQQLQQQQQHASNSSHVRRFTEGPPTCPIPSGKEFMRQKAINNGCLSSMKEENENVCSNNAFNKLVSNLNAIANGHRTLPSYRSNLDSSAECQGSLRSLVTPPPTPALSSTSTNHIRRLSETSDLRGSASSLAACSTFSASEEKQATELKKLKSELYRASEKVTLLSSQLVTNSQMVVAFEQSLASMTARLHQMSLNGEHKDREISRLKVTIDQLRKEYTLALSQNGRRGSLDNFHGASSESDMDSGKKKSPSSRSQSRDRGDDDQRPGWLRGSITKAFRKSRPRNKVHENCPIMVEHESEHNGDRSGPCNLSPLRHISSPNPSSQLSPGVPLPLASPRYPFGVTDDEARGAPSSFPSSSFLPSSGPLGQSAGQRDPELRHQLMDKERALTDIRLEALTTAHKMDGMKEEMKRLKLEIDSLRQENKRLQRLLYKQSQLTSSSHSSNTSVNGFVTHGHELYNGDKGAKGKSLPTAEGNNNNNHNCKDNSMHISDPLLNTLLRLQEAAAIH